MSERSGLLDSLITLGAAALGAVVVVRGTLSLIPDAIRYDRYGDTHELIMIAMYLLGLATAGTIIRALNKHLDKGPE